MIPILLVLGAMVINMRDISEETSCGRLYAPAQYIKHNTDKSSLFIVPPVLTPPDWRNFRLCADRAVVVDLNMVFTDKAVVELIDELTDNSVFLVHRGFQ